MYPCAAAVGEVLLDGDQLKIRLAMFLILDGEEGSGKSSKLEEDDDEGREGTTDVNAGREKDFLGNTVICTLFERNCISPSLK